jgi:CobQ/CobB/MinD/ParA nucleotide binding domain
MDQTPDDIFALYSRFDLDGDNYRVFVKPAPAPALLKSAAVALQEPPSAAPTGGAPPTPHPISQTPSAAVGTPNSDIALEESLLVPDEAVQEIQIEIPGRTSVARSGLRNLWQYVSPAAHAARIASAAELAAASISIHGAAGGVGSTTIAAVLARLLAKSGRNCAIFDEHEHEASALPIHFGGHYIAADHRRFSGLYSIFEAGIKILNPNMYEPVAAEPLDPAGFIERNAPQLAPHFDHLIFDQPARSPHHPGAGLLLYVAVPDVSSLLGVRKLKERLQVSGTAANAICVLNRFDTAISLHREVLGWYRENFGHVAIIHHSPLVPEALAEGSTIVDWAPRTKAAADFLELFQMVTQLLGRPVHSDQQAFAETVPNSHFETEGLPLCS